MIRKYSKAIEHIEVTPEMRTRILNNIAYMDFVGGKKRKVLRFTNIRNLSAIAACLGILLVGIWTLSGQQNYSNDPFALENNSILELASREELSDMVGFEVAIPANLPFEVENVIYTAYGTHMAEITCTGNGKTAVFRKGTGTEDVSGDYNQYELVKDTAESGIRATLKGSGETYSLAIWKDNEFSYSLSLSEGAEETVWMEILKTML